MFFANNCVYIPSIDGKDLYLANNYIRENKGYNLKDKTGKYKLNKFINSFDYSLDLIKLRDVYRRANHRSDFTFFDGRKEYCPNIINVTFKYAVKEFNRTKSDVYVANGYCVDDITFEDCIARSGDVVIGVETGAEFKTMCPDLPKCFEVKDNKYTAKDNIKTLLSVADIRTELYVNGFYCDGEKYVRFKRSAGSSRVGKCLFIRENLYSRIHRWETCGISVREGQNIDLAAFEPYIALTLSSIIDTINIYPENILVINDKTSVFKEKVAATIEKNGEMSTVLSEETIENCIWDGQSLMDSSMFGKYSDYGMLLLRGRFFKSCCFNTNLQKWFSDNNITEISQLNGKTRAKSVSDIKIVTTPSSIKFLKFGTLDEWLNGLDSLFGIVKHEKPTGFMDGTMVQSHYQLINTLQLTPEEAGDFVFDSLELIRQLKSDPAVLRYWIHCNGVELDDAPLDSKNDIVYRLLGVNDRFVCTKLYKNFRDDLIDSIIRNMRHGRLLIRGNYSTMCGNPVEMLRESIGKYEPYMKSETVCCKAFPDGARLLGSRSPHVTVGNILLTHNIRYDLIDEYLNMSKEIVVVNSINENLLQRLSGSDFDSDTVLLTDNKILIAAAERNYDKFAVPTNFIPAQKIKRKYTNAQKADLDVRTAVNKIGEIINLSQELNSKMWDRINSGESFEDVQDLYLDITQLDVMSNLEIDMAKRTFPTNNAKELAKLKQKHAEYDDKRRYVRPYFFKHVEKQKGYYDNKRKCYRMHKTGMDYVARAIDKNKLPRDTSGSVAFTELLIPYKSLKGVPNMGQVRKVLECAYDTKALVNCVYMNDKLSMKEKYSAVLEIKNDAAEFVGKIKMIPKTMYRLLMCLEQKKYSNVSSSLFTLLFSVPNKDFLSLIRSSAEPISVLKESESGDVRLFNKTFERTNICKY